MQELSRESLYNQLLHVQEAASLQNAVKYHEDVSAAEWAAVCMRKGVWQLAQEIMDRY